MGELPLREADRLEILTLVDNYTDVFKAPDTKIDKRPWVAPPVLLFAEHGFSCFLRSAPVRRNILGLFDSGVTAECLFHNAKLLNVNLDTIESVVLSHGHFDHTGGLLELLDCILKKYQLFFIRMLSLIAALNILH